MAAPWESFAPKPDAPGPWSEFKPQPVRPTATPEPVKPQLKRTWGETAADTALGVVQGGVNLVGGTAALVERVGFLNPLRDAGAHFGLLDKGGSTIAADLTARANEAIGEKLSPALQRKKQELAETEGFVDSAKKVLTEPVLAGQFLAEQVPNIATLGAGTVATGARAAAAARPAALATRQATLTRGASTAEANAAGREVIETARKKAGTRFLTGAGTTVESGNSYVQARDEALNAPDETWEANPAFTRLVSGGMARDEAKRVIANEVGLAAAAVTAPLAAAGARVSAPFETSIFNRAVNPTGVRGLLSPAGAAKVAQGAAAEGAEEVVQEGGAQFGTNVGLRQLDPNQELFEGVPEAAGTGGAIGLLLGGGMGATGVAASRGQQPTLRRGQPPEGQPTNPTAPAPQDAAAGVPDAVPAQPPQQVVEQPEASAQAEQAPPEDLFEAQLPPEGTSGTQNSPGAAIPPPSQVPFPDAPAGSLRAAVNVMDPQAPLDVAAAAAAANPPKEQKAPKAKQDADPAADPVGTAMGTPPPWVNPETGEFTPPSDADLAAEISKRIDIMSSAGKGLMPLTKETATAWGVDLPRLRTIRKRILDQRKSLDDAVERARSQRVAAEQGAPADTTNPEASSNDTAAGDSSPGADVALRGADVEPVPGQDDVQGASGAVGAEPAPSAEGAESTPAPAAEVATPRAAQVMAAFETSPAAALEQLTDAEVMAVARAAGRRFAKTAKPANVRAKLAAGDPAKVQAAVQKVLATTPAAPAVAEPAGLAVRLGNQVYPVGSLREAQAKHAEFRDAANMGSSEMPAVELLKDGQRVGEFSYNSRVWKQDAQGKRVPLTEADVATTTSQQETTPDDRNGSVRGVEAAAPAGSGQSDGGQADAVDPLGQSAVDTGEPVATGVEDMAGAGAATEPQAALTAQDTDRRANEAERARIDALPQDERDAEIERLRARVQELEQGARTNPLTGLPNKAAFEADEALGWPSVVAIDMDGLKRLNDTVGHENADAVLRALGRELDALASDTARFYHRSGDEFAARFKDPAAAATVMAELQADLEGLKAMLLVEVAGQPAQEYEYRGIGISYGLGATYEAADLAANEQKRERLAAGIREDARADGPPRRLRQAAADSQGREGDADGQPAAAEEVAPPASIAAAAAEAATSPTNALSEPTDGQKEAGNYKKGKLRLHGLELSIENPAGTRRRPEWPPLAHHYGYIRRTEGADGDHIDVFLGDNAGDASLPVFVVNQVNRDGKFDEHKVVMGFADEAAARKAYLDNYSKGWTGLGSIRGMSLDEFKAWLQEGDTTKPVKVPKAATKPAKKPAPKAAATEANTEDAGAELWYNRRNRTGNGLQWSDVEGLNATLKVKEAVKSKVWPRPDYEALVADGMHPVLARLLKQVYDGLSAKPNVSGAPADEQLREYVETIGQVRESVFTLLKGVDGAALAKNASSGMGVNLAELVNASGLPSLEDAVFPGDPRNRFRGNPDNNRKAVLIGGNRMLKKMRIGIYDVRKAAEEVAAGWPTPREAWERMFDVRQAAAGTKVYRDGKQVTLEAPEFFVVKRGQRRIAADGLPTREAAIEKARELASKNRKKGETLAEEAIDLANAVRTGAARRAADEDITSDRLRETFGFKGVNFGNWMKGAGPALVRERQLHLNHAYDAFQDMAELLDLPARSLSLNGMLGLAFGAQGNGKGSGAAHFVPGVNEINLTRAAGVGSLAHEWGHALDHYFAVQAGERFAKRDMPFITHAISDGVASGTELRPEVFEAFKALHTAMTTRPLTPAEVAKRLEEREAIAKRRLDSWIKPLREELARRAKPADKDRVLVEFDALAERIRGGDLGEGYVPARNARGGLRPVLADLRTLVKDATGRIPNKSDFDGLAINAEARAYAVANKQDATKHVPQTGASNYAIEAAKLDKDPNAFGGGNYWKLPTEMLARAFQSYVLDRLADRGAQNDYLTRPQMDEATFKVAQEMGLAPAGDRYPRGDERNAINAAFDTLTQTLRTREDDAGNVALFSQPDAAAESTPDQARVRGYITPLTSTWGATAPRVEVVADAEGLPARAKADPGYKTADGFYDDSAGIVYLVANRIPTQRDALRVLVHESVGHFGVEAITGPALWDQLSNTIARMRENPKHAALFAEIDRRYKGANAAIATRETLAVMAEKGLRNSVMDRAIAAIRNFIRQTLGIDLRFTEAELRQHLVAAARYVRDGRRPREAAAPEALAEPAFSKGTRSAFRDAGAFAGTVRAFLDGKLPGRLPIQVTEGTPDVLVKLGAPDVPITINRETLSKFKFAGGDKHPEITQGMMTTLVKHLHEPVAVFDSTTEPGALVVMTEVDADGKRVMASLHIRANSERMVVNRVTSLYGRERREDFARWAKEGRLRYLDRTRVPAWLTTAGLQLPGVGPATTGTGRRVLLETDVIKPFSSGSGAYSTLADPFYSALVASVQAARGAPKKGDAAAWKGWLDGAQRRGEFRQSERDWLGLDAWLEGRESTTRAELAEFVQANQVQVQDVVLDDRQAEVSQDLQDWISDAVDNDLLEGDGFNFSEVADRLHEIADEYAADGERDLSVQHRRMAAEARKVATGGPATGTTKYRGYQLPGGEAYRELLITLPNTGPKLSGRAKAASDQVRAMTALLEQAQQEGNEAEIRHLQATIGNLRARNPEAFALADPEFNSNHFDQPNVLAHVRFNERTDADGKRVLFIEEIQSDWHQQGRKYGYKGGKPGAEFQRLVDLHGINPQTAGAGSQIPDAPFKATDEWAMLAFKRMARWAVDNGFDRVAWTPGDVQAERYDLSKQVDKIEVQFRENGTRVVYPTMPDGSVMQLNVDAGGVVTGVNRGAPGGAVGKGLDEVVGKEMAERIMATTAPTTFSGAGLKVGGDGMRAFYDKILPAAVNKWAKKFGGKVGSWHFYHPGTDDIIIQRGADGWDVVDGDSGAVLSSHATNPAALAEADRVGAARRAANAARVPAHSLDLTDAMRDTVRAGQPLFSQPPDQVLADLEAVMAAGRDDSVLERARARLKDLTPKKVKDALRGTWLGALGTNHLTELGSDYFDGMRHYTDFLKSMEADRNTLMAEGEELAEKARKWASKHKAMARRLFDLMHSATIDGVDPSKQYQVLQFRYGGKLHDATRKNVADAIKEIRQQMRERSGDPKQNMLDRINALKAMQQAEQRRAKQYGGLVARWNELDPDAQQLYKDFRDTYAARSDAVEEALVQRIEDLKGDGVTDGQRRALVAKIREQFETNRLQGVYFPLQRFGRYFVAAEKGDTNTFLMYESLNEAERAEKDLKARGWKVTRRGKRIDQKAENAPSGTFVAEVIGELRKANISEKTQDSIYQLYLNALPELSMRKHQIHRKAVPGFDPDAVRAFGWHMQHGSHQLAKLRYMHKLEGVLKLLETQQKEARKAPDADVRAIAAGDAILEELNKRHDWIANPMDSGLTNLVSSFGFAYYLGLTPAAALVNLSQTAIVTFPVLAARYGPVKAANALLAGARDSMRTVGNIDRTLTDPEEVKAYQALKASGAIDKTQAHNLAGIADGGLQGYSPAWAKTMEVIGWAFHKAEVVNREASAMAAYRLARQEGMEFDAAVKHAHDVVIESHFDYSNANRARFMQSGTAKVLLMFRQYSLNITWFLARNTWQATKGMDPETKKMARRKMAGVLGMTALFSGTLGLPLMSVTFGVLNAVAATFGDDDEPFSAETEFKNFLADMLGPDAARVVTSGVANELTGADIASRVSLSQLWFRDADRELEGRGMYYHLLEQAAGPMGGVLKNALVGKQQIDEGNVWRGVETMLPKALKDTMKGARYSIEGVNNFRGDPLVEDVSLWQAMLQMQGFTPAQVARQYDANSAVKGYEQFILNRRQHLTDAYAMAWRLGDAETQSAVLEKMRAFNQANPELAISAETLRRSLKSRMRYSQRAEDGIIVNPKLEARVRGAVRFNGEG